MALVALVLGSGGVASAQGHHRKEGSLNLTQRARIGDAVLDPGEYKVRTVDSAGGAEVEFVREIFDSTLEGVPLPEEEVVARISSTERALSARSKRTRLEWTPEASAVALEIRGESVEYLFPSSSSESAGAMAADASQEAVQY